MSAHSTYSSTPTHLPPPEAPATIAQLPWWPNITFYRLPVLVLINEIFQNSSVRLIRCAGARVVHGISVILTLSPLTLSPSVLKPFSLLSNVSLFHRYLTRLDVFSLLVAAIGHDVGHNGLSNQYHTISRSKLALLYNDSSVLENMHASILITILHRYVRW